jgi:MFS family permease
VPQDKRICRKTDKVILVILIWVYFLQILDKSVLGYGSIFGLQKDTGLHGNQYSLVGSIAPIAQLSFQPISAVLIVKVPHRILMPALVLGWGIAQASMAACHSYSGLLATRFFLGLFEGACLPLFSVITNQWYRRAEQPIRVAAWYGTNGLATIAAAALSYGLGHIKSESLHSWQIIFLFVGLVTIVSAPFVYWKLDNDVTSARFLTEHEKVQAVERLRANQTYVPTPPQSPKDTRLTPTQRYRFPRIRMVTRLRSPNRTKNLPLDQHVPPPQCRRISNQHLWPSNSLRPRLQ